MKKLVSLALTLMLALSLCACGGGETREPDPTAEPTEELHIYTAEEGTLIREVWYNPNGLKFNTVIYEYDGFGEVVKELTFGINNAPVSYKEYTRDSDGRVSVMTSYVAEDAENYSEEYRVLYEYGETGLKLSETSKWGIPSHRSPLTSTRMKSSSEKSITKAQASLLPNTPMSMMPPAR